MKIGRTDSGSYFARYAGFVAIGKSAKDAYNNLVVLFQGAKASGNQHQHQQKRPA